ncbi:MAG: choice-of-anchor tandem repeat GloVer-containing protein [Verrucomicrobiota bacterium]
MKIKQLRSAALLLALSLPVTTATAQTQVPAPTFETVQGFPLGAQQPACKPVRDAAGNFYGTTYSYGAWGWGTIFKVRANGDVITLHHFNGTQPTGGLTAGSDGNYYGTTLTGGASNAGTFFKITPEGVFTVLHEFSDGADGGIPSTKLVKASDGNFYGATGQGGAQGLGTFYKITPAGILTTLVSWNQDAVGWGLNGDLIQGADGNFYGINRFADVPGHEDSGTIFRVSPSGVATAVASLAGLPGMDSCFPDGLMQASDGNFYGSTYYGGSKGAGTIYKATPAGMVTLLAEFGQENIRPAGSLIEGADGCLYGTSHDGGTGGGGTIYKITTSGTLTTLVNLEIGTSGPSNPWAGLVAGPQGSFYGTSETGGTYGRGTLFKLGSDGAISQIATFYGEENHSPSSKLLLARDGNFYGTTVRGGNGPTTNAIFKMTPSGAISTVANLPYDGDSTDACRASLVEGKAGIIFGTQAQGGVNIAGSVFQLDHQHELSNLLSFDGADGYLTNGVVMGEDGNLYGTNLQGGASSGGTIFRVTQGGAYSLLSEFRREAESSPNPGMIQGTDGNFYGTTQFGGPQNSGTVFKMTPSGVLSTFAEFGDSALEGQSCIAGVIEGSDHNFYGVFSRGGPADSGAIYQVTPSGVVTTLATFTYENGAVPDGQLIEGPDGAFYGVTPYGGTTDNGTVFRITKEGELTTVFNFDVTHGRLPRAGLTRGNDGCLYGATEQGGIMADGTPAGGGQIFRLRF